MVVQAQAVRVRVRVGAAGARGAPEPARAAAVAGPAQPPAVADRLLGSGDPCHAIVGTRELDDFGARILDLQTVLEATTLEEIEAAGRRLAELI
jgi:hypothetical protein